MLINFEGLFESRQIAKSDLAIDRNVLLLLLIGPPTFGRKGSYKITPVVS